MVDIIVLVGLIALAAIGLFVLLFLVLMADLRNARRQFDVERGRLLSEIDRLKDTHQRELELARKDAVDKLRAAIKGQAAERMAPFSPGFMYLPSDMHFIGYPIDYIVFKGLTGLRDNGDDEASLEVVLLEIKQGQSRLSPYQKAIKDAVDQKRVRFVTMTVGDGIATTNMRMSPSTPHQEDTSSLPQGEEGSLSLPPGQV